VGELRPLWYSLSVSLRSTSASASDGTSRGQGSEPARSFGVAPVCFWRLLSVLFSPQGGGV